jgi:hypothetical protein
MPIGAFECPQFRAMMRGYDPTGAVMYPSLMKDFVNLEFNLFLLLVRRALQACERLHGGNPFVQICHDAAWVRDEKWQHLSIQFISADFKYMNVSVLYSNIQCGDSDVIAAEFMETIQKRGVDISYIHSGVSDIAAMAVTSAMGVTPSACHMHNLSKVTASAVGTLITKDGFGAWWTHSQR